MDITTGRFVELDEDLDDVAARLKAAALLEADPDNVVQVRGELRQVQELGDRVRLGADEQQRRRTRRKQQRASRKGHR